MVWRRSRSSLACLRHRSRNRPAASRAWRAAAAVDLPGSVADKDDEPSKLWLVGDVRDEATWEAAVIRPGWNFPVGCRCLICNCGVDAGLSAGSSSSSISSTTTSGKTYADWGRRGLEPPSHSGDRVRFGRRTLSIVGARRA